MGNQMVKELKNLIIVATLVLGILGLYLLIEYIFPFLSVSSSTLFGAFSPFILALIIAIVIDPLVNTLEIKFKMRRSLAVLLSLLIVIGLFSVFLIFISARMVVELMQLSGNITFINTYLLDEGYRIINDIRVFILANPLPVEVQKALQDNAIQFLNSFKVFLSSSTEVLVNFIATLPLVITIIIVSAIATFFISKDKEIITNYFINLIPAKNLLPLNKLFNTLTSALTGFLRAQLFLVTMTATQAVLGLYLIGVEFAITIGVLVGIVDLIPILGPGSIFIPWSIWYFLIGNYKFGFTLLILYGILIIVRQLIEPKILGDSIGLHPLATLMAIFVGLRLLGIKGIFIGPIVLLVVNLFIQTKKGRRRS